MVGRGGKRECVGVSGSEWECVYSNMRSQRQRMIVKAEAIPSNTTLCTSHILTQTHTRTRAKRTREDRLRTIGVGGSEWE